MGVRRDLIAAACLVWTTCAAGPTTSGSVVLEIDGVKNTEGQLLVVLFADPEGYPSEPDKAYRKALVEPKVPRTRHVFADIPPGTYAGFVVHDENGNGVVDVGRVIPMPKEPLGATRDAKGFMGPPKFKSAAFDVGTAEVVERISLVRL
jgi:uncharacterized protein (DUF2141 family)